MTARPKQTCVSVRDTNARIRGQEAKVDGSVARIHPLQIRLHFSKKIDLFENVAMAFIRGKSRLDMQFFTTILTHCAFGFSQEK